MTTPGELGTVALVTLGCTRNEVDSEELAGRLQASGWRLVSDAADADVAVVNADDGYAYLWREMAGSRSVRTYGIERAADVRATVRQQGLTALLSLEAAEGLA